MSKSVTNRVRAALWTLLFGVALLSPGLVLAKTTTTNVTVTVTVTASNCRVNENSAVKAEFGTVQISELSKAMTSVPVTIACDEIPQGTLSMAIQGTGTSFNAQALKTNVSGLGITLTSPSSKALDLNTYYDVTSTFGLTGKTGTFKLAAKLVSDGKTELAGGEFNASATLVIQVS
ncbi:fimbrial protein [Enterobacter cloacae]|nr:fimbrial protein [Enterobacter cloacae]